MNKLDKDYQALLQDILKNGVKKEDRTGTGTLSVFGRQIRHKMSDGFPLLTTKKMAWKTMVTELLWFLKGDTNIKYLVDNGCHIWDGDAYKYYQKHGHEDIKLEFTNWQTLSDDVDKQIEKSKQSFIPVSKEEFIEKIKTDDKFAKKFGELGPIYGKQWRRLPGNPTIVEETYGAESWYTKKENSIDQIQNLINDLKTNPDSRRLMVNAWNVRELDQMVLPPCHYGFQVYTRELNVDERLKILCEQVGVDRNPGFELGRSDDYYHTFCDNHNIPTRAISLMWNQRSCDFPLGIPANIMSYSLLLLMIAKKVNMVPDELIGNFGDCHIYLNQIDGVKEQLTRTPFELPTVELSNRDVDDISEYTFDDIILKDYISHPKIYFPLSN